MLESVLLFLNQYAHYACKLLTVSRVHTTLLQTLPGKIKLTLQVYLLFILAQLADSVVYRIDITEILLSATMMLRHIDLPQYADIIESSVRSVIADKKTLTADICMLTHYTSPTHTFFLPLICL